MGFQLPTSTGVGFQPSTISPPKKRGVTNFPLINYIPPVRFLPRLLSSSCATPTTNSLDLLEKIAGKSQNKISHVVGFMVMNPMGSNPQGFVNHPDPLFP